MLTKDLVKFKRVKSRIIPDFICVDFFEKSNTLEGIAFELGSFFVKGSVVKDIDSSVEELIKNNRSYQRYINCFYKVLLDEIRISKRNYYVQRLSLILKAQELREKIYSSSEFDKEFLRENDDFKSVDFLKYKESVESQTQTEFAVHPVLKEFLDEKTLDADFENIGTDIYKDHPDRAYVEENLKYSGQDIMGLYNLKILEYFVKKIQRVELSFKGSSQEMSDICTKAKDCKIKLKYAAEIFDTGLSSSGSKKKKKIEKFNFSIEKEDGSINCDNLLSFLFSFSNNVDTRLYFEDSKYGMCFIKLDYSVPYKYYNYKKVLESSNIEIVEI